MEIEQTEAMCNNQVVQGFFTFIGFAFPYGMATIPFFFFFFEPRTDWLEQRGLYGTDFNKTY